MMRQLLRAAGVAACLALGSAPAALAQGGAAAETAASLAGSYRSYNQLLAAARDGAPATGAAGVTSTTGAEAGGTAAGDEAGAGGAGGLPDGATVTGTLPGGVAPGEALGQDVYGPGGADVAEIEDVLLDEGGAVRAVLLDVGGLLDLGERQVAVPVGMLRPVTDADGGASGGAGEGGGAAGVTGAAGAGAGTGAGAGDVDAAGDRPQLAIGVTEDELEALPTYRLEGRAWVREAPRQ